MSKKTNITHLGILLFISVVVLFIASTVQPDKETAVSTPASGLIFSIEEMPVTAVSQPVEIEPMNATPMTVEFVTAAPEPASKQPLSSTVK